MGTVCTSTGTHCTLFGFSLKKTVYLLHVFSYSHLRKSFSIQNSLTSSFLTQPCGSWSAYWVAILRGLRVSFVVTTGCYLSNSQVSISVSYFCHPLQHARHSCNKVTTSRNLRNYCIIINRDIIMNLTCNTLDTRVTLIQDC